MQRIRQLTAPKQEWGRRRFSVRSKAVAKWGEDALVSHQPLGRWTAAESALPDTGNKAPPAAASASAAPPAAQRPHEQSLSLTMGPDDVFYDDGLSDKVFIDDVRHGQTRDGGEKSLL